MAHGQKDDEDEEDDDDDEEDEGHVALSANPNNDTVWLGLGKSLYHFSSQGQLFITLTLSDTVQALALDKISSRLWVATQKSVSAYDGSGKVVGSMELGRGAEVQDLALDLASGDLWVALEESVRRYTADGTLQFEVSVDKLGPITSEGQGGLWVSAHEELVRLNASGQVVVRVDSLGEDEDIVALGANPRVLCP